MGSSRFVNAGGVQIGGDAGVVLQGMTSCRTTDVDATLQQVRSMAAAGAQLVRVSVPDRQSVRAFRTIRAQSPVPLIADCHIDPDVAIRAAKVADKLRLNPGNMPRQALRTITAIARDRGIPIRVGVNSGSMGPPGPDTDAMVKRMLDVAARYVDTLTGLGFDDIVLSFKSPDPIQVIMANRQAAVTWPYPLHLGVTHAGADERAVVFSVAGLAPLLQQGIGDTLRVSLAQSPERQVRVGMMVLQALGLRPRGPMLLACPVCARAKFDVQALAEQARPIVQKGPPHWVVAVIGCEVNGPGEGVRADVAFYATPADFRITEHGRTVLREKSFKQASRYFLDRLDQLAGH